MKDKTMNVLAHVIALVIALFIINWIMKITGNGLLGLFLGGVAAVLTANWIVKQMTGKPQKKYHLFKKKESN